MWKVLVERGGELTCSEVVHIDLASELTRVPRSPPSDYRNAPLDLEQAGEEVDREKEREYKRRVDNRLVRINKSPLLALLLFPPFIFSLSLCPSFSFTTASVMFFDIRNLFILSWLLLPTIRVLCTRNSHSILPLSPPPPPAIPVVPSSFPDI